MTRLTSNKTDFRPQTVRGHKEGGELSINWDDLAMTSIYVYIREAPNGAPAVLQWHKASITQAQQWKDVDIDARERNSRPEQHYRLNKLNGNAGIPLTHSHTHTSHILLKCPLQHSPGQTTFQVTK